MTHQAIRHGPELELSSWWCLEHVLHNWYSVEPPSLLTTRNGNLPTEPKGFRAEPRNWEVTVVNKTQGHGQLHTTTELQLSQEAAATPVGHPTGCTPCTSLQHMPGAGGSSVSMALNQAGMWGAHALQCFAAFLGSSSCS